MNLSWIGALITFQVTFTELFIAATVIAAAAYRFGWRSVALGSVLGAAGAAKDWSVMRRVMTALGWAPGPMPAFPYSHRVLATIRPGSRCSPGEWILNPAFTEWLMGWPIGWSDTTRPVTAFAPWLRRSRGALSDIALIDV